jgi:hypothetical protein
MVKQLVAVLCLFVSGVALSDDASTGFGPWRLGMSKAAVASITEFGPYRDVASTGGLETTNGVLDDRKTTISFVFGRQGLRKIQIWAYEGRNIDDAIATWERVHAFLLRSYGPVETPMVSDPPDDDANGRERERSVRKALASVPSTEPAKLQMAPRSRRSDLSVFASLIRHPQYGFYVFLYYQEP